MTAQATYYIIRALVALVAIPFHEAGQTRGASFAESLCPL